MAIQKKNTVKQSTLASFTDLQAELKQAKELVKHLDKQLSNEEFELVRAYHANTPIERGELTLVVTEKERRSVKWKEEFARVQGPQAVQDALDNAIPTIIESVQVIRKVKETRKSTLKSA